MTAPDDRLALASAVMYLRVILLLALLSHLRCQASCYWLDRPH